MTGKKKLETKTSSQKIKNPEKVLIGLIEPEDAETYLKNIAKQFLQVRFNYSGYGNKKVSPSSVGYTKIKNYIENMIISRLDTLANINIDNHINRLIKLQLEKIVLNKGTKKKINDKFEKMLLDYLDKLPEKERSALMMTYLMCRK